ncbi:hypothetical protein CEXT_569141 [Caerostris extrusa]|uniref:Uncharacterized protein n=1 Tax=Caerostris extrusa TaxID=172846 RepID=A0AAV4TX23_CAEEX|nr:hypothetical protein CEXT_569141 [Caerostris extrusa]
MRFGIYDATMLVCFCCLVPFGVYWASKLPWTRDPTNCDLFPMAVLIWCCLLTTKLVNSWKLHRITEEVFSDFEKVTGLENNAVVLSILRYLNTMG